MTDTRGSFVATGTNKKVQHLEGGIIKEILVSEGDTVNKGQVLIRLSETSVAAQLARLELRRVILTSTRDRLAAERDGLDKFAYSGPERSASPEFERAVKSQEALFEARTKRIKTERVTLEKRVAALEEEILGLRARKTSAEKQLDLLNEELVTKTALYDRELVPLPQLLQLRRSKYKLEGEIGDIIAQIGKAQQKILETQSQTNQLLSNYQQEIADEYRKAEGELDDVVERIKAAKDVSTRLDIVSPVRGTIVKLSYNTPGGVIQPGNEIMELLPLEERLIVEAYVRPEDRESVYTGLDAEMRLTALSARTTPTISGKVIYVSADSIKGDRPGEVYFIARVQVDEGHLQAIEGNKISPGMPVEVFIKTGERTLLEYIVRPILDSFARAFKEA